jgi:hypothetical protein
VDKIQYYSDLTEIKGDSTENFLEGFMFFTNSEFFYTLVKALNKKFKAVVILPSFKYEENGSSKESKMERMYFRVEGKDNNAVCKLLGKQIKTIKNRHGEAICNFSYNKKRDSICLEIQDIKLNKGEIRSVTKNQYSK